MSLEPVIQLKEVEVTEPLSTTHWTPSIITYGVPTLKLVPVKVTVVPPYIVPVFGLTWVIIGVETAWYWTLFEKGKVWYPLSRTAFVVKSVISEAVKSFRTYPLT